MKDLHQIWPHRWLSAKALTHASAISGIGVFANDKIKKGEKIAVLGGIIVPKTEIKKYWKIMTQVGIQIDDNFFIVPAARNELKKYGVFNHSCKPNIGFLNSITFIAIHDIQNGEELVFDYAFSETHLDGFICKCKSRNCRNKITAQDWKKNNLQKEYKQYFSPYLRNKIN